MFKRKLLNFNKKKILKILLILLFILSLFFLYNKVYADEELTDSPKATETISKAIMGFLNGFFGILLYIPGVFGAIVVITIYLILCLLFFLIGNEKFFVSPADIFYNKIPILSIDFFDFSAGGSDVLTLRTEIARWFVTLSGVATIFLLGVLIYIAIRAVLANTGQSKAKYQTMFTNWLISLGLLGLLGIIIVSVITLNNVLVSIIEKASITVNDGKDFTSFIIPLILASLKPADFLAQFAALLLFASITLQTFKYAFVYIKRMIKIAFLIMIAPLVTITYSIDKIADNKSQALNSWMQMFVFNVFIQAFHALIFSVFFFLALNLTVSTDLESYVLPYSKTVPGAIIAIMSLRFIGEAEKIIRQIFGIKDGERLQDGNQLTKFALASKAIGFAKDRLSAATKKAEKSRVFEGKMTDGGDPKGADKKKKVDFKDFSEKVKGFPKEPNKVDEGSKAENSVVTNAETNMDEKVKDAIDTDTKLKQDSDLKDKKSFKDGKIAKAGKNFGRWFKDTATGNIISKGTTMAGVAFAIAGGDLASGWGLIQSARYFGKAADKTRKARQKAKAEMGGLSKEELVVKNTKSAAKEAVRTHDMKKAINGEDLNVNAKQKADEMQAWFRMVMDKASSEQLIDEYKASRKDLIQRLQEQRGLTSKQAVGITHQLEQMIISGKLPPEGSLMEELLESEEGIEFANSALENKQFKDIKAYNDLESDIRNYEYDFDENVRKTLKKEDFVEGLYAEMEEENIKKPIFKPKTTTRPTTEEEREERSQEFTTEEERPLVFTTEEEETTTTIEEEEGKETSTTEEVTPPVEDKRSEREIERLEKELKEKIEEYTEVENELDKLKLRYGEMSLTHNDYEKAKKSFEKNNEELENLNNQLSSAKANEKKALEEKIERIRKENDINKEIITIFEEERDLTQKREEVSNRIRNIEQNIQDINLRNDSSLFEEGDLKNEEKLTKERKDKETFTTKEVKGEETPITEEVTSPDEDTINPEEDKKGK